MKRPEITIKAREDIKIHSFLRRVPNGEYIRVKEHIRKFPYNKRYFIYGGRKNEKVRTIQKVD